MTGYWPRYPEKGKMHMFLPKMIYFQSRRDIEWDIEQHTVKFAKYISCTATASQPQTSENTECAPDVSGCSPPIANFLYPTVDCKAGKVAEPPTDFPTKEADPQAHAAMMARLAIM